MRRVSTLGFVGCSNTRMSVEGYATAGGKKFWPVPGTPYSAGTVVAWATGLPANMYWTQFQSMLDANPGTTDLWWQLCAHEADLPDALYAAAVAVRNELLRRVPGVVLHVSALNGYAAPHVCSACGADGPSRSADLAARLVAEGLAVAGPLMPELLSNVPIASAGVTLSTNDTNPDGCHPNTHGKAKLGGALLAHFG